MNFAVIGGNLTRDAELKTTPGGTVVLQIGVAVNDRRKDRDGNWGDYVSFFDCVLFNTRAEKLHQYLTKGTRVHITGKLRQQRWQTEQGENRSRVEILVDDIDFDSREQRPQQQASSVYDDDVIPF